MASSSSGKMGVVTFFPHNTFNSLRDPYSQLRAESRVKFPQKKLSPVVVTVISFSELKSFGPLLL